MIFDSYVRGTGLAARATSKNDVGVGLGLTIWRRTDGSFRGSFFSDITKKDIDSCGISLVSVFTTVSEYD